jgi:Tfp pilus assembly protein PilZ
MPKPNVLTDRRASPRFPVVLSAEVTEIATGIRFSARTSDLSRNGCYIDTLNPLSVGSAVFVRLSQGSETIETAGKVVYVSPRLGMGIAFSKDLAPNQLAVLDRWLAQATKEVG